MNFSLYKITLSGASGSGGGMVGNSVCILIQSYLNWGNAEFFSPVNTKHNNSTAH